MECTRLKIRESNLFILYWKKEKVPKYVYIYVYLYKCIILLVLHRFMKGFIREKQSGYTVLIILLAYNNSLAKSKFLRRNNKLVLIVMILRRRFLSSFFEVLPITVTIPNFVGQLRRKFVFSPHLFWQV